MVLVGHHPNLVNLLGACSSEGESALKLELNIFGLAGETVSTPRFLGRGNRSSVGKGKDMYFKR